MKRRLIACMGMVFSVLTGCGKGIDTAENDVTFDPYLNRFIAEAEAHGMDTAHWDGIGVTFGETDGASGRCKTGMSRHIVVSETAWKTARSEEQREMIMFHEFGHCLLGRSHRNDETTGAYRVPCSLMNANRFPDWDDYSKHRTAYVDELFSDDGSCPN